VKVRFCPRNPLNGIPFLRRQPVNDATWWAPPGSLIGAIIGTLAAVFQPVTDAVNGLLHDVWNALPPSWRATGTAIADAWNSLDPNVRGAIVLVATVVAIVATGGIAAFAAPLAGTALGSVLVTASIGAAIGAVTDAIVYTGLTLATGGQWSLEGMANAAAFGALVGGVTAGGMKAFSLWRAGAFAGRVAAKGGLVAGVPTKGGRLAAGAREVDVSLESVQSGGKPLLGLTSFTKSGSKSVTYLGTHARLFRSEQTLTREILVTDVHETLHRALGYGVGQERWIDDLAYWSLGW